MYRVPGEIVCNYLACGLSPSTELLGTRSKRQILNLYVFKEISNENNDAQSGCLLLHDRREPAFNPSGSRPGSFQVPELLVRNDCGRYFKADRSNTSQCGRGPRTSGAD